VLGQVGSIPTGLTDLNRQVRTATNALDYSREPLMDWPTGVGEVMEGAPQADYMQLISPKK